MKFKSVMTCASQSHFSVRAFILLLTLHAASLSIAKPSICTTLLTRNLIPKYQQNPRSFYLRLLDTVLNELEQESEASYTVVYETHEWTARNREQLKQSLKYMREQIDEIQMDYKSRRSFSLLQAEVADTENPIRTALVRIQSDINHFEGKRPFRIQTHVVPAQLPFHIEDLEPVQLKLYHLQHMQQTLEEWLKHQGSEKPFVGLIYYSRQNRREYILYCNFYPERQGPIWVRFVQTDFSSLSTHPINASARVSQAR